MAEYSLKIRRKDGSLHFQSDQPCLNDDQALALARGVASKLSASELRIEIWRGSDCVYDGVPPAWPFRGAGVAASAAPTGAR